MFNDVLRHVVSVLILDKCIGADVKFLQKRSLCSLVAVFEHSLDHAATIRMRGKSMDLTVECLDDKLYMLSRNPFNSLLDYVVSVLIFDAFQDMAIQFFD